jgi:hypothetical protein
MVDAPGPSLERGGRRVERTEPRASGDQHAESGHCTEQTSDER